MISNKSTMNNLAACSKVLYDREVIQKNKEAFELKKRIKELEEKYEKPKIKEEFKSVEGEAQWMSDFVSRLTVLIHIFYNNYRELDFGGGYNVGYDTNFSDIVKLFEQKFDEFTDKKSSEWSTRICGTYLAPIIILIDTFQLDLDDEFKQKLLGMFINISSEIMYEEIDIK